MALDMDLELLRGRLRVHPFEGDTGVPILCVPGLSSNSRAFDAIGEYFEAKGRAIAAFDLRGRGWSDITPPGTYGWENHARDVFEAADAMEIDEFDLVGHSMGAFVGMTAASLDRDKRIRKLVLIDGVGTPTPSAIQTIVTAMGRLRDAFPSADAYCEAVKNGGLVLPWSEYWERHYRYDLIATDGGVRPRTAFAAVSEDAAYGATHALRDLWPLVSMPTLLLRSTVPLGGPDGWVVTREDYDEFLRTAPRAQGIEIAENHYGIVFATQTAAAIDAFLSAEIPALP